MTPLDNLKQALDTAARHGRTVNVFFRDDDADDDLPNLRRLLDTFVERDAPINLEVIPGTLTARGTALLQSSLKAAPGRIEVNQHGWRHTNHEPIGRKCEFGPSRTYRQQLEDIQRGRDVLDAAFGPGWNPVFTPPWNRCTHDTLRAISELGFNGLSNDNHERPLTNFRFSEIPTTFDLYTWKSGPVVKQEAEVLVTLAGQVQAGHTIGVLLHHKVMTPEAFRITGILLDRFARSPAVRLHTFEKILNSLHRNELTQCNA
jgi:hypothetical protein